MNKLIWGSMLATSLLIPGKVLAESNIFAGLQVMQYDLDEDTDNDVNDAKPQALQATVSGTLGKYGEVEARLGRSTKDDEIPNQDYGVKVDKLVGIYAKVGYPFAGIVKPYVIAGYSKFDLVASGGGVESTETDSGLSYGMGVNIFPHKRVRLGVEYMKVTEEHETSLYSVAGSVAYLIGE